MALVDPFEPASMAQAQAHTVWNRFRTMTHLDQVVLVVNSMGTVMWLNHKEQRILAVDAKSLAQVEAAFCEVIRDSDSYAAVVWRLLTAGTAAPETPPDLDVLGVPYSCRAQSITSSDGSRTVVSVLTPSLAPIMAKPSPPLLGKQVGVDAQRIAAQQEPPEVLAQRYNEWLQQVSPAGSAAGSVSGVSGSGPGMSGTAGPAASVGPAGSAGTPGSHPFGVEADEIMAGTGPALAAGRFGSRRGFGQVNGTAKHANELMDFFPSMKANDLSSFYIPKVEHIYSDLAPDVLPDGAKSVTTVENEVQDPDEMLLPPTPVSVRSPDSPPTGSLPRADVRPVSATKPVVKPVAKPGPGGVEPGHRCLECGADKSPEWRKGPNGAKTLCNACGLRYAKRLRQRP